MLAKISPPNDVRVVRIFLASPGDLGDERKAAREAVDEVNRTVARPAGFHIDLIGWEDTLSSAGRPQALINEDLATCQMFVGMLWARWGTPPDKTGAYSSGFEEEFSIASSRYDESKEPHLTLFFKSVDPSKMADPGVELQKVLNFRNKIIDEKKLLFDTFENSNDFSKKLRLCISDYINRLSRIATSIESTSDVSEVPERHLQAPDEITPTGDPALEAEFLSAIGRYIASEKRDPSDLEVARLKNLGVALSGQANDQTSLGAHDANLIYRSRDELKLSGREISSLADAGLDAFKTENIPLWTWLVDRQSSLPMWLSYSTMFGPDKRRIGAFRVMTMLKHQLSDDEVFSKHDIASGWFTTGTSDSVRTAAVDYLAEMADDSFLPIIKSEISRNSVATRRSALAASVRILARVSTQSAALYALGSSFDDISEAALNDIITGMSSLDSEELGTGMAHRCPSVRREALRILFERNEISTEDVVRYFDDPSAIVRAFAVKCYEVRTGKSIDTLEAAREIIVKNGSLPRGIGLSTRDKDGSKLFEKYKSERLAARSYTEIKNSMRNSKFSSQDDIDHCLTAILINTPTRRGVISMSGLSLTGLPI